MTRFAEKCKIRANRFIRRTVSSWQMKRLDNRPIPEATPHEVRMFLTVRNEALRLPHVLQYHFDLGVERAFVVDNGSTDGTLDLLMSDPRVVVYSSLETFRALPWKEVMLRRHGIGHWCLVLDADELFMYPYMNEIRLPEFVQYLDSINVGTLHSLFLDMYPRGPLTDVHYQSGEGLLDHAMYFDADGYGTMKYDPLFDSRAPEAIYYGGVRCRVFGGEFGASKFPLLKYQPHLFLRLGLHTVEGARIASEQAALLHFKFLQDFADKALLESRRGVYWNGSVEYKAYAEKIQAGSDLCLWRPESQRLKDWRQLVELGLMKSSPELDAFVADRVETS